MRHASGLLGERRERERERGGEREREREGGEVFRGRVRSWKSPYI